MAKMPPVAQGESETLGEVISELLDRGAGGITSARQLAARLAEQKNTTVEGERRSISRHMRFNNAEEESIVAYAKAFQVDRSVFPEATPKKRPGVSASEFADLQEQVADLQRTVERLRHLLPHHRPEAGTQP